MWGTHTERDWDREEMYKIFYEPMTKEKECRDFSHTKRTGPTGRRKEARNTKKKADRSRYRGPK